MGVGVSGAGARRAPAQAPQPARAPGRPPARPPAQPARARGIVRWNTAPSSPRRGGKTPWCSPSKVGAQLPKTLRRPPGEEGRENPAGPGVGQPRRTRRHLDPRGGARARPGCQRPAGGCHPRSCHPSGHPSPPGAETQGARGAPGHPRRPHPGRGSGVVTFLPLPTAARPSVGGTAGREWGGVPSWNAAASRVLTQAREPRLPGRSAVAARGDSGRSSPARGGGDGGGRGRAAVTVGRGTRAVRRNPRARPEARPEPLPARCAPPGPLLLAHTEPRLFSPGAVSLVT